MKYIFVFFSKQGTWAESSREEQVCEKLRNVENRTRKRHVFSWNTARSGEYRRK
jgi:hypothetical protein